MKLFAITLLFLILSLQVCVNLGEETDEGFEKGREKKRAERKYEYQAGDNEIQVKAENEDQNTEDHLEFKVQTDGSGVKIVVKYESDPKKDETGEFKVGYRFLVRGLVEYKPTAGQAGFEKGVSEVVWNYPGKSNSLGGGSWKWNKVVQDPSSTADSKIYRVETSDGAFALLLKFNPPKGTEGGLSIEPNDIKFDIDFNGTRLNELGYLQDPANRIAILGVVQSKYKTNYCADATNTLCLNSNNGNIAAFLRWANHLTCDGVNVNIIDSSSVGTDDTLKDQSGDADDKAQVTFWSIDGDITKFNGPCKWDPQITTIEGSASSIVLSILVVVIAILALFQ